MTDVGPIGRLGHYTATHFRVVVIGWAVIALGLGFLAPRVEKALSGAGWEATGSESVQARKLSTELPGALGLRPHGRRSLAGVLQRRSELRCHGRRRRAETARGLRRADRGGPRPGVSISPDGHTAIVQAGAAKNANGMVAAAENLKGPLASLGRDGTQVHLTGASGMWSDFNAANKSAMLRSEVISWPVTLAIMLIAFGSLVAAGLPLMLTLVGLIAAAGSLYLGAQVLPISIWAMNFALMFALALGIDYALFVVYRFRGAFFGSGLPPEEAVAQTMDTAGKAVVFSALTVLISLSAVMLVPSPAFRSVSLGIMLAVVFVLAATLTLLPAVLASWGREWTSSPCVGALRRASLASLRCGGERLWRHPLRYGSPPSWSWSPSRCRC